MTKDVRGEITEPLGRIPPEKQKSFFGKAALWLGHSLKEIGGHIPLWLAPVGRAFSSLGGWLVTSPRREHDISQEVPLDALGTTETVRSLSSVLLPAYTEAAKRILKDIEAFKPSGNLSKDTLELRKIKTSFDTLKGREDIENVRELLTKCEEKISEQEYRLSLASSISEKKKVAEVLLVKWRGVQATKDPGKHAKMLGELKSHVAQLMGRKIPQENALEETLGLLKRNLDELDAILDQYSSSPRSAVACSDLLQRCEGVSQELESFPELKEEVDQLKKRLVVNFEKSFFREAAALSKEVGEYSKEWLLSNIESFMSRIEALEETGTRSIKGDRELLNKAKELLLQKAGELVGQDLAWVRPSLDFYEKGDLEKLRGEFVDHLELYPFLKKAMLRDIDSRLQFFYLEEAQNILKELQSFKPGQGVEIERTFMASLWKRFDALQQKALGFGENVDEAVEKCRSTFNEKVLLTEEYITLHEDIYVAGGDFHLFEDLRKRIQTLLLEVQKTLPPLSSPLGVLKARIEGFMKGECVSLCPELKGKEINLDGIADREPLKSRLAEKKKEAEIQAFVLSLDKERSLEEWKAFLEKCSPFELMTAFKEVNNYRCNFKIEMQQIWLEEAAKREGFLENFAHGGEFYSSLDASLRTSFVTMLPKETQGAWYQALDPLNKAALVSSMKEVYSSKDKKASLDFLKPLSGPLKGALYVALDKKDLDDLVSQCLQEKRKELFSSLDREIYIQLLRKMEKKEHFYQALDLPTQKSLLEGLSDEERSGLFLKLGDETLISLLVSLSDDRPFLRKIGPKISAQGLASCIDTLSSQKRLSLYRTLDLAKLAEVLKAIPRTKVKGIYWEIAKTMDGGQMKELLRFFPSTSEIANSLEVLSQAVELMRLVEGLNAAEGKKYKLSVKDGELALVERSKLTSMGLGEAGKSQESLEAVARLLMLTTTSMVAAQDNGPVLEEMKKSLEELEKNDWFTSVCRNQEPIQETLSATKKNLDAFIQNARVSSKVDEIGDGDIEALSNLMEEWSSLTSLAKYLVTTRGGIEGLNKKVSEKVRTVVTAWRKANEEELKKLLSLSDKDVKSAFQKKTPLALILAEKEIPGDKVSIWGSVLREKLRAMSESERKNLFSVLKVFWLSPKMIKIFASENVRRSLLIAIDPAICEEEKAKETSEEDKKRISDAAKYTKVALTRYAALDDIFASLEEIVASSPPPPKENIRAFILEWFSLHAGDSNFEKFISEHRRAVLDVVNPLLKEGEDANIFWAPVQKPRALSKPPAGQELKEANTLIIGAIEGKDTAQVEDQIASDLTSFLASSFLEWNPTTLATAKNPSQAALKMSTLTNSIAYFVSDTIVSQGDIGSAIKAVQFWINIAEKCLEQGNLFAASAINAALNRPEMNRLLKGQDALRERLKIFEKPFATEGSYRNMRAYIEKHKKEGVIPFTGIYQTDATFINDGNPEKGFISSKIQLVGKIIEDLRAQQKILSDKNKTPPLTTDIGPLLEGTVERLKRESRSLPLKDQTPQKPPDLDTYLWKKSQKLKPSAQTKA